MKKISIIIFILLVIAAIFYWQEKIIKGVEIIINNNLNSGINQSKNDIGIKTSEEISISTPFIMPEGEISRGNANKKQIIFTFDCGS